MAEYTQTEQVPPKTVGGVESFSDSPILNSPYDYPRRHWEMDAKNQPTEKINEFRRPSSLKSPIATLRTARHQETQGDLFAQTEDGEHFRAARRLPADGFDFGGQLQNLAQQEDRLRDEAR